VNKVKVNIDGQKFEVEEGTTILEVAREFDIDIPTLCYNEALKPYGACRLCIVEVAKGGKTKIVASCSYPIREEDLEIRTGTERILRERKAIIELLLARGYTSDVLQRIASTMGVEKPRFKLEENECILCGLCTRVCNEIVGVNAISFINRGIKREVATPFKETSNSCIGCGTCAYICPTNFIKMEDTDEKRKMINWKTEFKFKQCKICNKYFAPTFQLEYLVKEAKLPEDFFDACIDCRK